MKQLLLLIFMILAAPCAHSQESEEAEFEIGLDQSVYPAEAFKGVKGAKVTDISGQGDSVSGMPSKEKRDAAFAKVKGLEKLISGFDQLDRDRLYLRARNFSPEKMRESYPAFDRKTLSELQRVVRGR